MVFREEALLPLVEKEIIRANTSLTVMFVGGRIPSGWQWAGDRRWTMDENHQKYEYLGCPVWFVNWKEKLFFAAATSTTHIF